MALTNNPLPSIPPQFTLPLDANMQFASALNLTGSGPVNNVNSVLDLGLGRFTGMLALDISAMDQSSGDETYKIGLLGSNDSAFGNGNVDTLAIRDFAAASAGRVFPTICAPTPAVPDPGRAGSLIAIPFTNFMQGFVYRFLKLNAIIGGTTPSITLSAWVTPIEMKV